MRPRITRLILAPSQVGELTRSLGPAGLEPTDSATLAQKILNTLESKRRLRNVEVRVALQAKTVVLAKEEHVCSILDNLLRNARDAACDEGQGATCVLVLPSTLGEQVL